MAQLPTGTVTFLFTDIEGSTQLLQRLGDDYARVLGEHQALLRAALAAHDGAEVDTQGDAFFIAFASAPEAVAAAAEATRALAAHTWPAGAPLRVRMGLHTGTPQLVGDHYVGLDVHRAARIAAAGHGGQVLLSQTTRDLAAQRLPAGATLRAVGAHRLKDLQEPEPLFQLVLPDPDLLADFPPLKTLDTFQHNLPVQPTPLLGREEQAAAVSALVRRPEVRLVTLTGPGGIGKTRLAIQVAAELVEDFTGGVWFVRLSRLVDPELVLPTIAQTLGLREQGGTPVAETLHKHVADKRLLLVLDNFEQVVAAATEVAALLQASPGLRMLVTSRLPLHLRGERMFAVPPLLLASPEHLPPLEQLTQYAAVALFVERAQAAQDAFTVTSANAPAIAEICARLDGLPLAIELAASRVRVLPPEAMLARLSAQLKVLIGGARDLEERQQTMRAAIAWSAALLSPEARVLFRRLAVFVGGCTLEAAEAVCATPTEGVEPLSLDLLDGLGTLVEQSLVQQRTEGAEGTEGDAAGGTGEPRFGMLHVIREYALEQLEASGEAESLRRAHAAFFVALAEEAAPELRGPRQRAYMQRLEREQDNMQAALLWAQAAGEAATGLRLATAVGAFWLAHGHATKGRAWLEAFLALAAPDMPSAPGVQARAYFVAGMLATWLGDDTASAVRLETSLALAREAGDVQAVAWALGGLGQVADKQGKHAQAEHYFEEALTLYRELHDTWGIAMVLNELTLVAYYQGQLGEARARAEEAVWRSREAGDLTGAAVALDTLARVVVRQGNVEHAAALGREVLGLWQQLGAKARIAEGLELAAMTAGIAGNGARAAGLLGAAAAIRVTVQVPWQEEERADIQEAVAVARAALGEERWAAAFAAGQALSLDEAIAEALGDVE